MSAIYLQPCKNSDGVKAGKHLPDACQNASAVEDTNHSEVVSLPEGAAFQSQLRKYNTQI